MEAEEAEATGSDSARLGWPRFEGTSRTSSIAPNRLFLLGLPTAATDRHVVASHALTIS